MVVGRFGVWHDGPDWDQMVLHLYRIAIENWLYIVWE